MTTVIWSPRAEKEFAVILEYLLEKWNEKVAAGFIDEVDYSIHIILNFPEIFPLADKNNNARKCVINKQVCLYYRTVRDTLQIISIFDSRQSPDRLML